MKRAKVVPPGLSKKATAIKAALMSCETLSASTRKMLTAGLVDCAMTGKDDRHPVQASVLEWIGQALGGLEHATKEQLANAQGKCAEAGTEKDNLDKAAEAAKAAFDGAVASVAAKKGEAKAAAEAAKAAKVALSEAGTAQREGDAELDAVETKNAALEAVRTNAFLPLKEGTAEQANVNKLMKQTIKVGEDCDFDASMLGSLPAALSKAADARGTFDLMVLDQFEDEYRKATEAFNMALRTGAPGKEERANKVEAAKNVLEQAVAAEAASKEAQVTVQNECQAAEVALEAARDAVKAFVKANKSKTQEASNLEKDLANLQKGALAFLEDLKSWDGKPPEKKNPQYKVIKGRRYDWELLNIAKSVDSITKEIAERLFTSAMDGPGVTPTEKRTLKYIIQNCKIDEESRLYLETKMGTSWYQAIDGVTYERNLLTMAAEANQPLALEAAQKLWESAMDSNEVTPTEKATLEYILNKYQFEEDARGWLISKIVEVEVIAG